jgi:outer membrane protein OmpA-like peptidoglycan-associated protein
MNRLVCLAVILLSTNAAFADRALVMTESTLSVTGLKDAYENDESIDFEVRVPRSNVIRARLEVIVFRGDVNGRALYQKLRDYDRYTSVGSLSYKIVLPYADRAGALSLFLRVRGVRTGDEGADIEPFEESLGWPLNYIARNLVTTQAKSGTLPGRLFFQLNSSTLTEAHSEQISAWAKELRKTEALSAVRIEGHADKVGNQNYNLELSRRRAEAVRTALIHRGIPRHLIDVVGYGFSRPSDNRAVRDDTEGVAANRRAEVLWFSK